jgi:hypothetical protein
VAGKEEYEVEKILQSAYKYYALCYRVKYRESSEKESDWLLAENLANAPDIVHGFHTAHPNQTKPPGWGTRSRPGMGQLVTAPKS